MNVFCFPGLMEGSQLCSILGVKLGSVPCFGFKPAIPLSNERTDQTEIDMCLDSLLIEAKLTETNFQKCPLQRLLRYRDLERVFNVEDLPVTGSSVASYQLIRGVLAAHHLERSFVVLCDARRRDLIESWFQIMRTVQDYALRSRLALLTWQELAAMLPDTLQHFLQNKYGIKAA